MNSGKKIPGELVVARGDGAEVFELVEEALDEIAFAVERLFACTLDFAIGLWGNHGVMSRRLRASISVSAS